MLVSQVPGLGSFYVGFSCSPCSHLGSLRVLQLPPQSKDTHVIYGRCECEWLLISMWPWHNYCNSGFCAITLWDHERSSCSKWKEAYLVLKCLVAELNSLCVLGKESSSSNETDMFFGFFFTWRVSEKFASFSVSRWYRDTKLNCFHFKTGRIFEVISYPAWCSLPLAVDQPSKRSLKVKELCSFLETNTQTSLGIPLSSNFLLLPGCPFDWQMSSITTFPPPRPHSLCVSADRPRQRCHHLPNRAS